MKRLGVAALTAAIFMSPIWSAADDTPAKGSSAQEQAAEEESDLEALLAEFASTPKEHAALARYFRGKATRHRRLAEHHAAMAKSYTGTKFQAAAQMRTHCEKIAQNERSIAALYDDLAKDHEQEASR